MFPFHNIQSSKFHRKRITNADIPPKILLSMLQFIVGLEGGTIGRGGGGNRDFSDINILKKILMAGVLHR